MNMKIITLIALALGCLAVVGIANMTDDSDAAIVDPSTGTQVGDLYYTFSGDEATVVGISSSLSSATSITIPDTVESGGTTYNVTAIADGTYSSSVFGSMTTLESVTISSNMTTIGNFAFVGCTSLADISLPDGLTYIGMNAFQGCTSLTLDSLPSGLTDLLSYAFRFCSSLALTSLPDGLTHLYDYTFYGCTSLALTSLPDGLTYIGSFVFAGCTSLETLSLPLGITNTENAFKGCTNLTLSLDVSVTAGGETYTDQWVTGLTSNGGPTRVVTLPSTSGDYLIDGWNYESTDYANGDSLTFPVGHHRAITGNAIGVDFGACGDNLTATMLFADNVLTITGTGAMYDYTAGSPAPWDSYKASIVSLSLPEGMTTYGDYAFYGCTGLSGILTIPSAITHVGDSAFYDCGYSAMIIEGSPTLTDAADPTFGSADAESFKQVLNLGDTVIEAGQYGLPGDAVVSDCIPLLGYIAPTSISETVQKEGAAYDLMSLVPVIIILAVLVMAATAVIKRD